MPIQPRCGVARHLESEGRPPPNPLRPWSSCHFPCHRRSAGDAQQLRHLPRHGADAQVGRRRGAAADREGADYLFRWRADNEPGADEPPGPRQLRPVDTDRYRGRRRAPTRFACRSLAQCLSCGPPCAWLSTETNAVGCGTLGQLRGQAGIDRPGAGPVRRGGHSARGDQHLPANQRGEIAIRSAANIKG